MDAILGLKAALRDAGRATQMPDDVLARMQGALAAEPERPVVARARSRAPLAFAAAVACVAAAASFTFVFASRDAAPAVAVGHDETDVIDAVVERHTRDVPVDVASPDPQSVAAFLEPRVGHGVAVPRLDRQGYGLFGGRIVDVHEQRTAQLVYRGGLGQKVSLMTVPDERGELAKRLHLLEASGAISLAHHGHNLRVWSENGSVHALVGDLAASDLERLSSAIER